MIGLCFVLFIILAFRKQVSFVIQFLIRSIFGSIILTFVNMAFGGTVVGVNLISILTIGFLGIPGFVLLYVTKILV